MRRIAIISAALLALATVPALAGDPASKEGKLTPPANNPAPAGAPFYAAHPSAYGDQSNPSYKPGPAVNPNKAFKPQNGMPKFQKHSDNTNTNTLGATAAAASAAAATATGNGYGGAGGVGIGGVASIQGSDFSKAPVNTANAPAIYAGDCTHGLSMGLQTAPVAISGGFTKTSIGCAMAVWLHKPAVAMAYFCAEDTVLREAAIAAGDPCPQDIAKAEAKQRAEIAAKNAAATEAYQAQVVLASARKPEPFRGECGGLSAVARKSLVDQGFNAEPQC